MDKGAHFYRCDFQVHTPRDINWQGERHVSEDFRAAYADRFVKACRERGLHAVAITDHHDTAFFRYIREAAARELDDQSNLIPSNERLVVFPGIEMTIAHPPAQFILIFDPDLDIGIFNAIPSRLGIAQSQFGMPTTCETQVLNLTVEEILARLSEDPSVSDKAIALPNVKPGGHKTFLREGFHTTFSNLPCVGGYIEGILYNDIAATGRRILEGEIPAWSTRPYGVFQTSDCRSNSLDELGKYSTWVKWSNPSAEALRQACLSRACRILQTVPDLPKTYIKSITVSNSKFLGPVDLYLNPQYNSFIGGRGTGKSSLLEYIRWGVCDPSLSAMENALPAFEKKRTDLINNTLKAAGALITIEWVVNDVVHRVTRNSTNHTIGLKIGNGEEQACTAEEVNALIPIQAYSQKQLSTVGVEVGELLRFISTPILPRLRVLDTELTTHLTTIRQNIISMQDKKRREKQLSEEDAQLSSYKEQLSTLRGQLTGLPKQYLDAIMKHPLIEQERTYLSNVKNAVKQVEIATEELLKAYGQLTSFEAISEELSNSAEINGILTNLAELAEQSKSAVLQANLLCTDCPEDQPDWCVGYFKWLVNYEQHNEEYLKALSENEDYQQQLKTIEALDAKVKNLETSIANKRAEIIQLGTPDIDLNTNRQKTHSIYIERHQCFSQQCDNLTSLSGGVIQATMLNGGDLDAIVETIKDSIQGSNVQTDKIKAITTLIAQDCDPYQKWFNILDEFCQLSEFPEESVNEMPLPDLPLLQSAGLSNMELKRIASKLTKEKYLALGLFKLQEKPVFKYSVPGGSEIDFEQASAGQQATALLKSLLADEGPPLIIDQPEDDLDNEVITTIAAAIWDAKQKRQIIFSSHNANLVVIGDADQVVHFGYRSLTDQSAGEIKKLGSIDIHPIREAVKTVMEGGNDAFKLRLEKYGF